MENVYLEVFVKEPTVLVDLTENVEIRNDSLILRKLDQGRSHTFDIGGPKLPKRF